MLAVTYVVTAFVVVRLAPSWGDVSLALAVVPVSLTGWLTGLLGGLAAGMGLLAGVALLPLAPGIARPDLEQWLLLITIAASGPASGAYAQLKRAHDRHRRASSEARFDSLTGLRNRAALAEELAAMLQAASRNDSQLAVLFVDLDRFKIINDTFGHDAGDVVLREVARRIAAHAKPGELTARLGGDEFVLAIPDVNDIDSLSTRARRLLSALGAPIDLGGTSSGVGASIGISVYPTDGDTVDALIKFADSAMYQVKSGGKNYFSFSTDDMRQQRNRQLEVERCLKTAMAAGEFAVHYQPQVELRSGRVVGFEALLRWHSSELGQVSPEEFIPIAEETGMIVPLGHWLLREVCQQASSWRREGLPAIRLAVNVSPLQFSHPDFISQVKLAVRDAGMLPNSLELEITEGLLLQDFDIVLRTLQRLRRLEIRVTLDDFGTGYSSLSYLERLPIASLKIPQGFVAGTGGGLPRAGMNQERSSVIVQAISAMAHKLSKTVIAEGIENESQLQFLRQIGVDYGQGYLFGSALRVSEAEELQREQLRNRAVPADRVAGRQTQLIEDLLIND